MEKSQKIISGYIAKLMPAIHLYLKFNCIFLGREGEARMQINNPL